jgi:hypothetical protein
VIEEPADVPKLLKQATIELKYRTGMEPEKIVEDTGISKNTVYAAIER